MSNTVREIAEWIGGAVEGDAAVEIRGLAGLSDAVEGELSFVADRAHLAEARGTRAAALLLPPGLDAEGIAAVRIRVDDPAGAMERLVEFFHGPERAEEWPEPGVHPQARVDPTARISGAACVGSGATVGARTRVGPCVVVGRDCRIGEDCVLHPGVVLYPGVTIGARVVLHAGVVVGADGFGYAPGPSGARKLRHVGTVVIEDDVEVGANSTIDRARFGRTRIGAGSKLDDQVHVGHNVQIGRGCLVAAQVGFAGSAVLGDGCMVGGQAAMAPHSAVGPGSRLAGRAGVTRRFGEGMELSGAPAGPHREQLRVDAEVRRLPRTLRRIAERLARLESEGRAR